MDDRDYNLEAGAGFLGAGRSAVEKVDLRASLEFRRAVWLFPLAYALHVLEELPRFTDWAKHYASASFTMRDYLLIHLSGLAVAIIAPAVIWFRANRVVVFLFLTFVFTPAVGFNIIFHTGATAAFRAYSPGLLTSLTLYPPLLYVVTRNAFRAGLLTRRAGLFSFVVAGLIHGADVLHNVFKVL